MLIFAVVVSVLQLLLLVRLSMPMPYSGDCARATEWGLSNGRGVRMALGSCVIMPSLVLWLMLVGLGAALALLAVAAVLVLVTPTLARRLPQT